MRRANKTLQERVVIGPVDHAAATADTTTKMWNAPRPCVVERVLYVNPTGLAEHASAFFAVKLLKGSTVVASKSTDSATTAGDDGIAADTFTELALSATPADIVFAAGDEMKLFLDRGAAAATLPAGRIVVEVRYL